MYGDNDLQFNISIHAPRVRCDGFNNSTMPHTLINFNPRTSCEVRPKIGKIVGGDATISIHAPRVRCDTSQSVVQIDNLNFNPRTSCEVRPDRLSDN